MIQQENSLSIRYVNKTPLLRYMVSFSYGQTGKTYHQAKSQILNSGKWKCVTRGELSPQEEDLYEHLYYGLVDTEDGDCASKEAYLGNEGTNIGCVFRPIENINKRMHYHFYNEQEEYKQFSFSIVNEGIFIFRTGIGIYWYEIDLNKQNKLKENEIASLTPDELEVFQNRFKELNTLRIGNKKNWYRIVDNHKNGQNSFTMGHYIANKLKGLLGEVYYFPPRVSELVRVERLVKCKKSWEAFRKEYEDAGKDVTDPEYINRRAEYLAEKDKWNKFSLEQARKLEAQEGTTYVVPDRAILFSYVVFNAQKDIEVREEKNALMNKMCEHVYHLTRGYKYSYRVSDNAEKEKQNMLFRHENDVWDASLEGAGCYVLIYDNLYDKNGNLKSNSFYDNIRPVEMQSDYFILYILLLYQHYSLLYFQQLISNKIPIQAERFLAYNDKTEALYMDMHKLKIEIDTFLANSVYGAVSHISDVCAIYSFIEQKMMIRENIKSLQQGFVNLESLQNSLCKEKESVDSANREKHLNYALTIVSFFAVLSVYSDAYQLVECLRNSAGDMIRMFLVEAIEVQNWLFEHADVIFNIVLAIVWTGITFALGMIVYHIRKYFKLRKEKS